ncbi:hypothetical protein PMKS-004138 [Pichia membranifaciens]|uniref:NAD(+) diphosphatase n=1 Tax=Pichia membranifaciens TaxID=4926 RepID=A0A1Q2YML7_9ASCO|nr:hypothetical protein PMKS-004138 [Pichia membranifaciens]
MKRLLKQIDVSSKLIVFSSRNKSNRLEALLYDNQLAFLDIHKLNVFSQLLQKWLAFNTSIEVIVKEKGRYDWKKIDAELKEVSLFWLGMDDLNVLGNTDTKQSKENASSFAGPVPVYAIDISNSDDLCKFVDSQLVNSNSHYRYSEGMGEILQMNNELATAYAYSKTFVDFLSKNNFCPSCGGHVIPVELGSRLYCLGDSPYPAAAECKINLKSNNVQFPRTDPCVIIALSDDTGRVLLGNNSQRHPTTSTSVVDEATGKKVEWKKRFFSCFAGFMEPGETIEHACVREVYEETGLRLKEEDITIIESQPWPFPANLMIGCIGTISREEAVDSRINVHLDDELEHVQWFDRAEVAKVVSREGKGIFSRTETFVEEWFCPSKESVAGRLIERVVQSKRDSTAANGKL